MEHINELLNLNVSELTTDKRTALLLELSMFINDLINNDFNLLVQILYRVDVSENKLKKLLIENQSQDAANIIAKLLIDRQIEKYIKKAQEPPSQSIPDEEKW